MRFRFLTFALLAGIVLGTSPDLSADDDFVKPRGSAWSDIYSDWSPGTPWMSGTSFGGGEGFSNSIAFGLNFFGSTFDPENAMAVEIRFSASETTLAQTYRRDQSYAPGGVGVFNGSVWDVSDPANRRQLNILFVEDNDIRPADLIWNPDASSNGAREYLFIMNTTYDGTGTTYGSGGRSQDVVYAWWPRVASGHTMFETDPATLTIGDAKVNNFVAIPSDDGLNLGWNFGETDADSLKLYASTTSPATDLIATLSTETSTFAHTGLMIGTQYFYRIDAVDLGGTVIHRSKEIMGQAQQLVMNLTEVGQLNEYSTYGDVWGYTAPDGKEYALLNVRGEGVSIIDISADVPVEVGLAVGTGAPASFPDAKDVKVYDHYAILINENKPAQIFDLADVTNPVEVSTIHIGGSNSGDGGAHNAFVDGDYLYVTGGHGAEGRGVSIFDITDPAKPVEVGGLHSYYYHDIYVKDNIGYGSAATEGVDIIDLTDKANPTLINNFDYDGQWVHNATLSNDSNYLYVGDENGSSGKWTRIYDVSDFMNPVMVSEIIADSSAITHNSYQRGNFLYIAHYSEGLQIYDVSDKSNPVRVAFYDTYLPQEYGFYGAWSVYPYFASNKILISDMQEGLIVLSFNFHPVLDVEPTISALPTDYHLSQNFPNPFNASTVIRYGLPTDGDVTLTIHDLLGHEVATLTDGYRQAGSYRISWHPGDRPSGIYFARLTTEGGYQQTIKLTLLK